MYQIFVVEDELLIRQNVRHVIEGMSGPYAFCGEASDGEMALSMMQDLMPDILLTDIRMPFLDGFELIRNAKAMMPWLKVVIISGYDDFEYARKAITLGVDQYLLKPVRQTDLTRVIQQLAQQIEEGKIRSALPKGYDKDEVHAALRQHFMRQLLYGGADTATLLERARALQLDIVRPCYQVVLFYFDAYDLDQQVLQAATQAVLGQMDMSLFYFNESNQMTLLAYGGDVEETNETVYQFINILRHQLKDLCPVITTVIGNMVHRLSAICDAYKTAANLLKKVSGVSAGQVVDVNDTAQITADVVEFSSPFGIDFRHQLQYATLEDVPRLVDNLLQGPSGPQFNSMLMRYNGLIDIFKATVQMISRSTPGVDPKDLATQLSSKHNIFVASGSRELFRATAIQLLEQAVSMKKENLSYMKYSHVISRAEKYIAENFCDPNISMMSTAKHVGMSSAHFSTVFSQTLGRSFINYLTVMRIEKAKELLATSSMKLASIAMEIGYNEPNYFSHVFRKVEGITPKEYRSRMQQNL